MDGCGPGAETRSRSAAWPARALSIGWSRSCASRAIAVPTSANVDTIMRGCTENVSTDEVAARSMSIAGCGANTPF